MKCLEIIRSQLLLPCRIVKTVPSYSSHIQLKRVKKHIRHAKAKGRIDIFWFIILPGKLFYDNQKITSDLQNLIFCRLIKIIPSICWHVLPITTAAIIINRNKVDFQFILKNVGSVKILLLSKIGCLQGAVHNFPRIWHL